MMTTDQPLAHPLPITIEQVENGYMLTISAGPDIRFRRDESRYEFSRPHVFASKAALFAHLAEYFTYEATKQRRSSDLVFTGCGERQE